MSQNIKKNILLFVILSFMVSSIYGQSETITSKVIKKDEKGNTLERVFYNVNNKEIAHLYFDSEGNQIKIEGKIPDGVVVKSFYDNGNLQRESIYKDNKFNGILKDYYENGKLESETSFKNDKREGISKEYYENGKLKDEYNYKNDKQNGITKTYYESGNLKSESTFKDGKKEGVEKDYYESGNLNVEFNYIDGKKEGIAKIYYKSGKLQIECNFKNDKLEGVEKDYYESGNLHIEFNYIDDKKEGIAKTYYESGKLESESNFKDGKLEGILKSYNENGSLEGEYNYINGEREEKAISQDNKDEFNAKRIPSSDFEELISPEGFKIDIPYNAETNLPKNNETEKLFKLMISQFKHRPVAILFKTDETKSYLKLIAWMIKHYKYAGAKGFGGSENIFIYNAEDQDFSITISPIDIETRAYGIYIVVNAIN